MFHGYAFDGIWVIARAINTILKKKGYPTTLDDNLFRGDEMTSALNETDFIGVTVSI